MTKCPRCKRKFGKRKRCYYCDGRPRTGKKQRCKACKKWFYVAGWELTQTQGPRLYCSKRCQYATMRGRELVKGTRSVIKQGYVMVKVGIRDVRAEHRIVMEQALGRPLNRNEHVHHINGNKQDNRLENLIVLTNAEHQKLHDFPQKRSQRVSLTCHRCGASYERKAGRVQESRYCSRRCQHAETL